MSIQSVGVSQSQKEVKEFVATYIENAISQRPQESDPNIARIDALIDIKEELLGFLGSSAVIDRTLVEKTVGSSSRLPLLVKREPSGWSLREEITEHPAELDENDAVITPIKKEVMGCLIDTAGRLFSYDGYFATPDDLERLAGKQLSGEAVIVELGFKASPILMSDPYVEEYLAQDLAGLAFRHNANLQSLMV